MKQLTVKTQFGTFTTKEGTQVVREKVKQMQTVKTARPLFTLFFLMLSLCAFAQPIVGSLEISDDKVILVQNQVSEAKSFDLTYWKGIKLVTNNIPSKTTCKVMFEGHVYTILYGSGKYEATDPKGRVILESTTIESIRAAISVQEYKRKTGQDAPLY
jgi:hypothetical protein